MSVQTNTINPSIYLQRLNEGRDNIRKLLVEAFKSGINFKGAAITGNNIRLRFMTTSNKKHGSLIYDYTKDISKLTYDKTPVSILNIRKGEFELSGGKEYDEIVTKFTETILGTEIRVFKEKSEDEDAWFKLIKELVFSVTNHVKDDRLFIAAFTNKDIFSECVITLPRENQVKTEMLYDINVKDEKVTVTEYSEYRVVRYTNSLDLRLPPDKGYITIYYDFMLKSSPYSFFKIPGAYSFIPVEKISSIYIDERNIRTLDGDLLYEHLCYLFGEGIVESREVVSKCVNYLNANNSKLDIATLNIILKGITEKHIITLPIPKSRISGKEFYSRIKSEK